MQVNRRTILLALTVALAVTLAVAVITTVANMGSISELLTNGGFEGGFDARDGCGMVAKGWGCFTTGGRGGYGFYDDMWEKVVAEGTHAQLIEINTNKDFGDQNRTAGIYQTVDVVPGQVYQLSFRALMRANDLTSGGDPWRYAILVGFAHDGSTDWAASSFQEVDAGPIQDRLDPTGYKTVNIQVPAAGKKLTIFIAGRMKWGDWNREVDFDIDQVSLMGLKPSQKPHPPKPGQKPPKPPKLPKPTPTAPPLTKLVCDGANLLKNGDFEDGFYASGVATGWWPYNNGGAAKYGYYDDSWPPVVAQGKHAQLLEINTLNVNPASPNRLIGIYQPVTHLTKGVVYQISLSTLIREEADHSKEDPNRYEVYWGFRNGSMPIKTAADLDGWYGVPVSGISLRTAPGGYSTYSTTFQAPGEKLLLYLFGMKKWATEEREADFDFDAVQLRPCRMAPVTQPTVPPPAPNGGSHGGDSDCTYVVLPGNTLSGIAAKYHTTTADLAAMNGIKNPNIIRTGWVLKVPCAAPADPPAADPPPAELPPATPQPASMAPPAADAPVIELVDEQPAEEPAATETNVHVVAQGEHLGQIAARYGTTIKELKKLNNIKNVNRIRVGQALVVPNPSE